ncbi:outer membrane lipoprotein-sorting protein, partial [Candidatus Aerophobetes bacterium]
MKKILLLVLSVVMFAFSASPVRAINPEKIIEEADKARGPGDSFRFELKITSLKPDRKDEISKFEVLVKGIDKSLVKFTYPRRDKGKVMLMVGNNLWIYIPTARNPIRISQQQRLMGQVSNGDVARTNFAAD